MSTGQRDVDHQEGHQQRRQHRDVQGVEPRERLVAELAAAHHDLLEVRADHRSTAHDVGHDLGRPVALLVPGELVAGMAESDGDEQQGHPEPPGELARSPIGPRPDHLEQVQTQQHHHRLSREVVDSADEPAVPDLAADVEDARPGRRGRRAVRRHQQDAGERLDQEHHGQGRAEDVPPARAPGIGWSRASRAARGTPSGRRASRPVA